MQNNKPQRERPGQGQSFWVIGAGRFGSLAVARIRRRIPDARITVVDRRCDIQKAIGVTPVTADGVAWLYRHLERTSTVDLLIPAIPEHVTAAWLALHLEKVHGVTDLPIPEAWLAQMPHACRGARGQAYISHADFLCPDSCPEPKDHCTYTGRARPAELFRLIENLAIADGLPIVVRSYQLLPGVGGIRPADLWQALDTATQGAHRPLLIATACRCHGVVNLFRLRRKAVSPKPN